MQNRSSNIDSLLSYLATGIRSSTDIQQRFNCSQATVSRLLAQLGDSVFAIGRARARRYTALRDVRNLGSKFPIYKIDEEGNAHTLGTLFAVAQDQFLWRPVGGQDQVFDSLPWFLADLRPDGFVGRAFVRQSHEELMLPPRSIDWSEDHVLVALARRGEDTMGNLVIGTESLRRYLSMARNPEDYIDTLDVQEAYPRLAMEAMSGKPTGSSAGGEQPKFTAIVKENNNVKNVLVKFSPSINSPEGRRWADLLVCEHLALNIIRATSRIPAAQSKIIEINDLMFLEVTRFDRAGQFGRLPIISLRAVDNEFYGNQDNWINAADRLEQTGKISIQDSTSMKWLSVFSSLIGNNDQHFGNISLIMIDGSRSFTLAPAYDILPMIYRPINGIFTNDPIESDYSIITGQDLFISAINSAAEFWKESRDDSRISENFRNVCNNNYEIVSRIQFYPRLIS